jgi:hypothetical protein
MNIEMLRTRTLLGLEESIHSMSNAVANGLAGAGGGIIAQIITYPLQTVHNSTPTALSYYAV